MPEADAAPMCEKLEGIIQETFKKAVKEKPLKNSLTTQDVMSPVYDRETGDPTGDVEFKFN